MVYKPFGMGTPGKYAVLAKVADGGMAEIFVGTQFGAAGFERRVILKRLRPELLADKELRQSLLDEAQIAMRLHHGNIAHVLDVGEAAGHLFLVLELVDGWSLDQLLKRSRAVGERIPLELVLYVAAELCRGLAYAHVLAEDGAPLGIVHRDISPHNVLLSDEGAVKLTDFGIARASIRENRTGIGVVKGKPNYMSPEQALGQALDARSDLFSVGTLLYQLVTDVLPFKGNDDYGSLLKVQAAKFTPVAKLREGVPRGLVRLINKALEREPADRFGSAQEMLEALEKVLRTEFEPAGQSELKRYLAALAQRDGSLPLSKRVAAPKAAVAPESADAWIELSDVFPGAKAPSNRPDVAAAEVAPARSRAVPVALVLLALAGAAGSAWWFSQQAAACSRSVERRPSPRVRRALGKPPTRRLPTQERALPQPSQDPTCSTLQTGRCQAPLSRAPPQLLPRERRRAKRCPAGRCPSELRRAALLSAERQARPRRLEAPPVRRC